MAGDLVLITGVSGHLGFRVLATALEAGYRVRAAVRRQEQAEKIKATSSIRAHLDKLEFVFVPDILKDGAYDRALEGVAYVVHVASPIAFPTDDYERDLIQPAVRGTVGILASANNVPTIKRVVITSSVIAVTPWENFIAKESDEIFSSESTIATPEGPYGHYFEAYAASKTKALHATQDFVASNKPSFDIINVMPSFIIGKNELVVDAGDITNGTNGTAIGVVLGNKSANSLPGVSVHVDDVAKVHVLALDKRIPGNQNYVTSSGGIDGTQWDDAIEIVKRSFPEAVSNGTFPLGGTMPSKAVKVDASETEKVFGLKFLDYEEQVKSVAQHYIDLVSKA